MLTVALWQVPYGPQILYPFTLLATWAHELGHGLTALILGGEFHALEMHFDGSGLARWSGSFGAIRRALVAAGGLLGPSVAGVLVLLAARRPRRAPAVLAALSGLMVFVAVWWARSAFAVVFALAFGAAFFAVVRWARGAAPFVSQLVGVQLCLAVFRDVDYMFSPGAVVDGVARPSDSAQIAEALLLPYWFWGALVALTAFLVLAVGLWATLRPLGRATA